MLKNKIYSKTYLGILLKKLYLKEIFDKDLFSSLNFFRKKFSLENIFIYFIAEKLSLTNCIFFFSIMNTLSSPFS